MEELVVQGLKGLVAAGPVAVVLFLALRHQTNELKAERLRNEQLYKEKEDIYIKVVDVLSAAAKPREGDEC